MESGVAGVVGKDPEVFSANFAKWLRGDVRVKDDARVEASDIADYNLILFGDPGSNSVIAKVIGQLPIRWSKTDITIGTHTFGASDHVPVIVYPNPLNPKAYVVINSGHTFGDDDFRGTNAWLYPRLGDYSGADGGRRHRAVGILRRTVAAPVGDARMTRTAAVIASLPLVVVALSSGRTAAGAQPAGSAPNVLLIQADDLRLRRPQRVRPVSFPDAGARSARTRRHAVHAVLRRQHRVRPVACRAHDRHAHRARLDSRERRPARR